MKTSTTGFISIEEDSEDEETDRQRGQLKRRNQLDGGTVVKELYLAKCKNFGATPVSKFLRTYGDQTLNLVNNSMGPRGAMALAAPLKISTTILELYLGDCDIQATGMKYLTEGLIENVYVEILDLSQNNLGPKGAEYVSYLLLHNTTITSIDLSGNHFGDKAANSIASIIQNNVTLDTINLASNELGKEAANQIGTALGSNTTLESLDLSWNTLRLKDINCIAKALKTNKSLRSLDLAYNGVGFEGASALGDALKENSSLLRLNLTGANLVDKAVFVLGKGLQCNRGIQTLYISNNPITDKGWLGLFQCLSLNQCLATRHMHLQATSFSSDILKLLKEIQRRQPLFTVFNKDLPLVQYTHPLRRLYHHMLLNGTSPRALLDDDDDDNGPGRIATEEFIRLVKGGCRTTEIFFDGLDVDVLTDYLEDGKDGFINYERFVNMWGEFTCLTVKLVNALDMQREQHTDDIG